MDEVPVFDYDDENEAQDENNKSNNTNNNNRVDVTVSSIHESEKDYDQLQEEEGSRNRNRSGIKENENEISTVIAPTNDNNASDNNAETPWRNIPVRWKQHQRQVYSNYSQQGTGVSSLSLSAEEFKNSQQQEQDVNNNNASLLNISIVSSTPSLSGQQHLLHRTSFQFLHFDHHHYFQFHCHHRR